MIASELLKVISLLIKCRSAKALLKISLVPEPISRSTQLNFTKSSLVILFF